jgi:trehalose synthase
MLDTYRETIPPGALDELYRLADTLCGRTLQYINSTRSGGGVAEILHCLVPLTEAPGLHH